MYEPTDRSAIFILLLIGSLSLFAWIVTFLAPVSTLSIAGLLLSISLAFFSFLKLIHIPTIRSLLIAIGILIFFSLRLIGLRDIWYPMILIALLLALDRMIVHDTKT